MKVENKSSAVTLDDIEAARLHIQELVHYTPVLTSALLNELTGAELWFKAENLQKGGAFKARGATHAVMGLSEEQAAKGVATHSSGNHGAALARAARLRGIQARIVMPSNAPQVKKDAVIAYGGEILECEPTQAARQARLQQEIEEFEREVVHPYDDVRVIAAQGTVGLELLEQVSELDAVVIPVGGGGLLAGMATAIKAIKPSIEVIGAEPAGADDAFRSFGLGRWVPQDNPQTLADGLRSSLGQINFPIIQACVDTILTVEEDSIVQAMQLQWSRLKTVVESSAAVPFAAVLEYASRFKGRRVACVISGGNLDLQRLPW